MTDLAAQILAALDRAEETARAAAASGDGTGEPIGLTWNVITIDYEGIHVFSRPSGLDDEGGLTPTTAHMQANDPAHVLRLTTALREVATMCADQLAVNTPPSAVNSEVVWLAEDTLRALASVWDVPGDNT